MSQLLAFNIVFAVLFCVVSSSSGEGGNEKLLISLFYESKCPYSVKFNRELYPLYRKLHNYFDIEYVPYGNTKSLRNSDGSYNFQCQHGEDECYGNKLHSCALSKLSSEEGVRFVGCALGSNHPDRAGPFCAGALELTDGQWEQINRCARGEEGDALLWENGERTNALIPPLRHVPWVIFNGVYSRADQDESGSNLLGVICRHLAAQGTEPPECSEESETSTDE